MFDWLGPLFCAGSDKYPQFSSGWTLPDAEKKFFDPRFEEQQYGIQVVEPSDEVLGEQKANLGYVIPAMVLFSIYLLIQVEKLHRLTS